MAPFRRYESATLSLIRHCRDGFENKEELVTNLSQVGIRGVVKELHGKLVAPQKDRVRIVLLGLQARAEVIQRRL